MSASTVSITAKAAAARRRPVLAGEKKSNAIELLPNEAQLMGSDAAATAGNTNNDKIAVSHSKDLSHQSIRGEAVTSKDLAQVKKTSSTVSPRRTRKLAAKPRWQTVVRVFTKNFVLLLVLIGLVQMVRRLVLKSGEDDLDYSKMGAQLGFSEFEGRISETESFIKTAVKMIQVQVEVVDKKIESEVGGLKRDLNKKIDEKGAFLENELKRLEARSEGLGKSIEELKALDWLSKDEFDKFYEELKKRKGQEISESDVGFDDIRAYAREIVQKEIEKHAADGLGRVDYAVLSGGAMVVKHSKAFISEKGPKWYVINQRGIHPHAERMLRPSFGEPGHCFALEGSSGFVQIKLRTAIIPEAITLEHVAKSVAYDRSSAPKDCRISGWLQGSDTDSKVDREMFLLAEFTYDLGKSKAQTFNVLDSAASHVVDTVRLDFTSNHGNPSFTCIYRLRVHGYEPESVSMMAVQP